MGRPPPLTDKQKQAIRTLARNRPPTWIADKLNLPAWRIRRACKAMGVTPPCGKNRPLFGVNVLEAIERLGSVVAVAEHYGCSEQAVRQKRAKERKEDQT